ncbi:MAG: hypothetical protein H7X75_01300, partial [Burkholderiaceae bacterium]|nr:hypothetical protein [Burkholderiaceae bacterium]
MPERAEPGGDSAPTAALVDAGGNSTTLRLGGAWRLTSIERIASALDALHSPARFTVDGSGITEIDSAGALVLLNYFDSVGQSGAKLNGFADNELRIVEQVRSRLEATRAPVKHRRERLIEAVGRHTIEVSRGVLGHINFLGAAVVGIGRSILHPHTV